MADVIGVASGVISLVQNARTVFNFVEAMKDAPKDVKLLRDELGYLVNVLEGLDVTELTLTARDLLELPLSQCRQDLDSFCEKLRIRRGIKGGIDRFNWPLKQGETKKQIEKFESLKNLFTLILIMENRGLTQGLQSQISQIISALQAIENRQEERAQDEDSRLSEDKHRNVLAWLSPDRYDAKHQDTCSRRTENTGQWIVETPEFQKWISNQRDDGGGGLLWGKGHPGAGKTFLCSVVIDHLQSLLKENFAMGVAYFYFTYDNQDAQKLEDILASLAMQLTMQSNKLPGGLEELYSELEPRRQRPTVEQLEKELFAVSRIFSQVFFVFDALDEYLEENRPKLLSSLDKMLKNEISIFVSSRPHLSLNADLECDAQIWISAQQKDLKIYIERALNVPGNDFHRTRSTVRHHIPRIISVLTQYANGIFQLAVLLLDELRALVRISVNDMLKELDRLENITENKTHNGTEVTSKGKYDAMFGKTLHRLCGQHPTHQRLALTTLVWLAKAKRVLTIKELQEAVSVTQNGSTLTEDDLPEPDFLVDICVGLLTINKTDNTFRLVHETVQQYILSRRDLKDLLQQDLDYMILEACTTYLSLDIFQDGPCRNWDAYRTRLRQHPLLLYAAQHWKPLATFCDKGLSTNVIFAFLQHPANLSSYIQVKKVGSPSPWILGQIAGHSKEPSSLHVACAIGHRDVVRQLLEHNESHEARDQNGRTPLHSAARSGNADIVRLLLKKDASVSASDDYGGTPLHKAAYSGNADVVELLLDKNASVSASDDHGRTPLHDAAFSGNGDVVRLLLDRHASVAVTDDYGSTPLHDAAYSRHADVVRLLLDKDASDNYDRALVHDAAYSRHADVVQLLLDKAVNVLARDSDGRMPLHLAARSGNADVVRLLLDKDAYVSTCDSYRDTPLHLAARSGNADIVRLLLNKGASASAIGNYGCMPLHLAAYPGNVDVLRLLLDKDASVTASDDYGSTPLHEAASNGHVKVAQLLLEKEADISAIDKDGDTPLRRAADQGHADLVRLLLEWNANVEA